MDRTGNEPTPERVRRVTEHVEGYMQRNAESIVKDMPGFEGWSVQDIYLSGIASGMINTLLQLQPVRGIDQSHCSHPSSN